jgi:hypothetical protein
MRKFFYLPAAILLGALTLASCSSDDDKDENTTEFNIVTVAPVVDNDNYAANTTEASYKSKVFGNTAIDACGVLVSELTKANTTIATSKLTEAQEAYLRKVLENLVSNVIVPTYTKLADDVEDLEKTLNGLTVQTITQAQIDKACADFKDARMNWERSEAFLGGAASDFSIDPTIDSWPLDRAELLDYFKGGMTAEIEDESTILGFHALEFILFRNGQNRKVSELQGNDTYTNFESISGADELKYAQQVCRLLKERCFQLQVAWEGEKNQNRASVVKAAGLGYQTENGLTYGDNLTRAGISGSKSTFPTLQAAIAQILSNDEGSCVAIGNEVGTAKIANPFSAGDIAYVESPYSYNSIADFRDNIRSIRNVWLGSTDKTANQYSFHTFFASVGKANVNAAVEGAYVASIAGISNMPSPFVKYCGVVWGKNFDDPENWESTSEE